MSVRILIGDCRETMKGLADASVDSVVCDPPYHLTSIVKRFGSENAAPAKVGKTGAYARASKGFMGQTWDGGDVAFQSETWVEILRVLKPGGHLVAFSGTRTYHRMVCAIEDAGFEIRDQLAWIYGSGFPKSLDVSKQIDKAAGAEREVAPSTLMAVGSEVGQISKNRRCVVCGKPHASADPCRCPRDSGPVTAAAREWQGWGTALKPSWEPICLARKPLIGTVVGNVLAHGCGALNIDACRIEHVTIEGGTLAHNTHLRQSIRGGAGFTPGAGTGEATRDEAPSPLGRWPANLCHDGSDEVLAGFPDARSAGDYDKKPTAGGAFGSKPYGADVDGVVTATYADSGSAARFFYCAKATTDERGEGNNHPTVKPQALMQWLCRLVTPKGGTVLDPFMGSGSTGLAADAEQFNFIGCELSADYAAIAERRMRDAAGMFADVRAA